MRRECSQGAHEAHRSAQRAPALPGLAAWRRCRGGKSIDIAARNSLRHCCFVALTPLCTTIVLQPHDDRPKAAPKVAKKKTLKEKLREREEAEQKKAVERAAKAGPLANKLAKQRLVEQSDFAAAKDAFGVGGGSGDSALDSFLPKTEADFIEYAGMVAAKIQPFDNSAFYKVLLKEIVKKAVENLRYVEPRDVRARYRHAPCAHANALADTGALQCGGDQGDFHVDDGARQREAARGEGGAGRQEEEEEQEGRHHHGARGRLRALWSRWRQQRGGDGRVRLPRLAPAARLPHNTLHEALACCLCLSIR